MTVSEGERGKEVGARALEDEVDGKRTIAHPKLSCGGWLTQPLKLRGTVKLQRCSKNWQADDRAGDRGRKLRQAQANAIDNEKRWLARRQMEQQSALGLNWEGAKGGVAAARDVSTRRSLSEERYGEDMWAHVNRISIALAGWIILAALHACVQAFYHQIRFQSPQPLPPSRPIRPPTIAAPRTLMHMHARREDRQSEPESERKAL